MQYLLSVYIGVHFCDNGDNVAHHNNLLVGSSLNQRVPDQTDPVIMYFNRTPGLNALLSHLLTYTLATRLIGTPS